MGRRISIAEAAELLLAHDDILILTHKSPDGDTLGSGYGLLHGLLSLGKRARVECSDPIADRYSYMFPETTLDFEPNYIVAVDIADTQLLGEKLSLWKDRIDLCMDHHGSNKEYAEHLLLEADSAAACEVIYLVLKEMGVKISPLMADCIYTGIATDTGCFRYSNTTAHTFAVAAKCAAAGAGIYELNQELFETNTLGRLKMQAWIVDHMQLIRDGAMAIVAIPKAVEEEIGVTQDDMDNISSFPRTVAGVCMAATLREAADEGTKISVRAIPGYDATKITEPFGGGGHKGAAGASLKMPLCEAVKAVEKAMLEL
jgi:phosphoesterase RecJ-like protein